MTAFFLLVEWLRCAGIPRTNTKVLQELLVVLETVA
jgi:hypothetical protein